MVPTGSCDFLDISGCNNPLPVALKLEVRREGTVCSACRLVPREGYHIRVRSNEVGDVLEVFGPFGTQSFDIRYPQDWGSDPVEFTPLGWRPPFPKEERKDLFLSRNTEGLLGLRFFTKISGVFEALTREAQQRASRESHETPFLRRQSEIRRLAEGLQEALPEILRLRETHPAPTWTGDFDPTHVRWGPAAEFLLWEIREDDRKEAYQKYLKDLI